MKKALFLLIGLLTLCLPKAVQATDVEGFYLSGFGGLNFLEARKHHDVKLDFKTGVDAGINIGYRWCGGLRLEGEFAYRYNKNDKVRVHDDFDSFTTHVGGHYRTWALMANVLYDIPVCWCLTPYIGAGIGYAHQNIRLGRCDFDTEGSKKGFAWQLIAGVTYPIDDCWDLALEGRYFRGNVKRVDNYNVNLKVTYFF